MEWSSFHRPDSGPRRSTSPEKPLQLSREELAQGEREIQEWNKLWSAMEAIERRSLLLKADHLRSLAIWGCIILGVVVFALLLRGQSGAPLALLGGAVAAALSVWIYSVADVRTPLVGPVCAALAVAGGVGLLIGLLTPKSEPAMVAAEEEQVSPLQEEMQRDMETVEALIMNRHHVPVTENWRPAQMSEIERAETRLPPSGAPERR